MRLFASTTPRTRCASARSSSRLGRDGDPLEKVSPPLPLAQQLTKEKRESTSSKKSSRRRRNVVHPIDLRDLESELDLLPDPVPSIPIPASIACPEQTSRPYTASVTVLHALDLHNPCQIRSCPHGFLPHAQVSVDGITFIGFDAMRHAKNYSSWSSRSRITHRVQSETSARLCFVRVSVAAQCTRHPKEPALVRIGHTDDIALTFDPSGTMVSQFFPVFRYHLMQRRMVKYFAGKIKLAISLTLDPPPLPPDTAVEVEPATPPACVSGGSCDAPPVRQAFLPVDFGNALQLKRKQLKSTVAPAVVNHALSKPEDDPVKTHELMKQLETHASRHLVAVCDVHVLEAIGEGVHATVFRTQIDGVPHDIAMKEFRYATSSTSSLPTFAVLQAFQQEYEILSLVSTADSHDSTCTLRLVGMMVTPRLAIFTDYCSDGSLARCLVDRALWSHVSIQTKLDLAHQIATGLLHLHGLHVVHRDIKPHNILIHGLRSQHPIAKIGDLGSAVVKGPTDAKLHEEMGSSGYTAPEVFGSIGYDHRADIWSLGIVLWELFLATGDAQRIQNPFMGACGDEVIQKAEQGERPEIPPGRLPFSSLDTLLQRCWDLDPYRRPSAADIAEALAYLMCEESTGRDKKDCGGV